jgi:hypothetical protein
MWMSSLSAIAVLLIPSAAANTIRDRVANPLALVDAASTRTTGNAHPRSDPRRARQDWAPFYHRAANLAQTDDRDLVAIIDASFTAVETATAAPVQCRLENRNDATRRVR